VQNKLKAANILLKQYGLIILALTNITDDAKVKGYVKQMTSFKTLALLHLFVDLLAPISKLSEYLQGDSTNLLLAQSAVEAALVTLSNAKDATYGEQLGKLVTAAEEKLAEGENDVELLSVSIGELQDGISVLKSNADKIGQRLSQQLTSRFEDILSQSSLLVRALKVLDVKVWPETKEDLYEFGKPETTLILRHFAAVYMTLTLLKIYHRCHAM